MNPKEHRKDFNRRWKITSSDSYEEAFKKFKQRIINIISQVFFKKGEIKDVGMDYFCQYYGIVREPLWLNYLRNPIIKRLHDEKDEKEFYRLIEVICIGLILEFQRDEFFRHTYLSILQAIQAVVQMSDVNVAVRERSQGGLILYPKGEKKLDEELVNKTLLFLNTESNKHFEEALKLYQRKKSVKSAESLRRSLEEFLRHKLQNTKGLAGNIKSLEENIKNIQKELKKSKGSPEIRNIIAQTFNYLDNYFNENSKHKDGEINEPENEFLIYQTGLLLRYINTFDLKQKSRSSD